MHANDIHDIGAGADAAHGVRCIIDNAGAGLPTGMLVTDNRIVDITAHGVLLYASLAKGSPADATISGNVIHRTGLDAASVYGNGVYLAFVGRALICGNRISQTHVNSAQSASIGQAGIAVMSDESARAGNVVVTGNLVNGAVKYAFQAQSQAALVVEGNTFDGPVLITATTGLRFDGYVNASGVADLPGMALGATPAVVRDAQVSVNVNGGNVAFAATGCVDAALDIARAQNAGLTNGDTQGCVLITDPTRVTARLSAACTPALAGQYVLKTTGSGVDSSVEMAPMAPRATYKAPYIRAEATGCPIAFWRDADGAGTTPALPDNGTHARGSRLRTINPDIGDVVESVCTVAGTVGTWASISSI